MFAAAVSEEVVVVEALEAAATEALEAVTAVVSRCGGVNGSRLLV